MLVVKLFEVAREELVKPVNAVEELVKPVRAVEQPVKLVNAAEELVKIVDLAKEDGELLSHLVVVLMPLQFC